MLKSENKINEMSGNFFKYIFILFLFKILIIKYVISFWMKKCAQTVHKYIEISSF